jgi:hypothetical protein
MTAKRKGERARRETKEKSLMLKEKWNWWNADGKGDEKMEYEPIKKWIKVGQHTEAGCGQGRCGKARPNVVERGQRRRVKTDVSTSDGEIPGKGKWVRSLFWGYGSGTREKVCLRTSKRTRVNAGLLGASTRAAAVSTRKRKEARPSIFMARATIARSTGSAWHMKTAYGDRL